MWKSLRRAPAAPRSCGNGTINSGEVCDEDLNNNDGKFCSADCQTRQLAGIIRENCSQTDAITQSIYSGKCTAITWGALRGSR